MLPEAMRCDTRGTLRFASVPISKNGAVLIVGVRSNTPLNRLPSRWTLYPSRLGGRTSFSPCRFLEAGSFLSRRGQQFQIRCQCFPGSVAFDSRLDKSAKRPFYSIRLLYGRDFIYVSIHSQSGSPSGLLGKRISAISIFSVTHFRP